ncbi:hypothetical protein [Sphingopyxis macrogoltabida]|uniref:hypothetical protein n=1 Tax=Sphingopyxis macrogoltabida TaxID=33050 RepID=UPI00130E3F55|nr:hypothetical protein [Sphingopyxis macrogoltabida]
MSGSMIFFILCISPKTWGDFHAGIIKSQCFLQFVTLLSQKPIMLIAGRIISQDFQNLGLCDSLSQMCGGDCHNRTRRNFFAAGWFFASAIRPRKIRGGKPGSGYKEKFIFDTERALR